MEVKVVSAIVVVIACVVLAEVVSVAARLVVGATSVPV